MPEKIEESIEDRKKRQSDNNKRWMRENKSRRRAYRLAYIASHREEIKKKSKEWYTKNIEEIRIKVRQRRRSNPGKYNAAKRKRRANNPEQYANTHREWRIRNPEKSLFNSAKSRAKKLNIKFDLELSDIVIPTFCPILGIPLKIGSIADRESSPSVDRKINANGYTKDNIRIISFRANQLKNNATIEEVELILKYMKDASPQAPRGSMVVSIM